MLFLTANQQCQSTEGIMSAITSPDIMVSTLPAPTLAWALFSGYLSFCRGQAAGYQPRPQAGG